MPPTPPESQAYTRMPGRNIAQPVYFVIRGAEKRRAMATRKAQQLQRELGVIPKLTSLK